MAETTTSSTAKRTPLKLKKKSTRMDLTPMVDLGFLLITFFVFTTTMSAPTVMKMMVPKDSDIITPVPESSVMTVILDDKDDIYYYEGKNHNTQAFDKTTNSAEGIRPLLLVKKKKVENLPGQTKMILIIKATKNASYNNLVNMLDEVTINQVPVYFMADLTPEEEELLEK